MKKKIDVMTVISIVLIILTWLGIIIRMQFESDSCELMVSQNTLQILSSFLGGIVYAKPTVPLVEITFLDGIYFYGFRILELLCYIWCLILVMYPIIRYIVLSIKLHRAKKDYVTDVISECEIKKKDLKFIAIRNFMLAILLNFSAVILDITGASLAAKPVIYIYPETETTVQVSVGYPEKLSCVYPEYDEEGWEVIAKPNGDLVDTKTGRNLYCLYWEGNQKQEYKFKDGFVVAGEDSAKFLEEKLAILGLNEREANEFIIYWLPKLEANKYNLIRFETAEEIEEYMPLNIEPRPDTIIRIVMDFKGLNKPIEIEEQKLEQVEREGYTVVEWGGSEF